MINIRRISHATFETPDLEAQIEHYTKVTGLVVAAREKDRALLSCRVGQLVLQLVKGERARCAKLAFQVAPGSDFGAIAKWLTTQGVKSDIQSDDIPGMSKSLAFEDIKGTTIELITDWTFLTPNQSVGGVAPFKFGHVAFVVPDVQAVADFYGRILGFRVSDWIEDIFVFMRCNPDHHTVNFVKGKRATMHHFAFQLRDFSHLENGCDVLSLNRIPIIWGPLRHGPGHNVSIYHRNPDGQVVEFFAELDQLLDEELGFFDPRPWHEDQPQRPKVWTRANRGIAGWGPPPSHDWHMNPDE
jgi:catechol 2,3-dioxygenase-like lactoylglutathione lyase family enzyme